MTFKSELLSEFVEKLHASSALNVKQNSVLMELLANSSHEVSET